MSTEKTVWQIRPWEEVIAQAWPRVDGDIVCQMPAQQFKLSLAEWPKRARLICAAPDLLAACELALEWSRPVAEGTRPLGWALEVQPALEAAVAKAAGANKPTEPEPCSAETPDEPAPARKSFSVLTQTGKTLHFMAQSVEEYDGGLGFYVGPQMVGLVAANRWTAYWLDGNA